MLSSHQALQGVPASGAILRPLTESYPGNDGP
jgi:hypothetical protein